MSASDPNALRAAGFLRACALSDVPGLLPHPVDVDGQTILICRQMFGVYAVAELCPHEHVTLSEGTLDRKHIVCPLHRYEFSLTTGECSNATCEPLRTYETKVLGGEVWVRLEASDGVSREDR